MFSDVGAASGATLSLIAAKVSHGVGHPFDDVLGVPEILIDKKRRKKAPADRPRSISNMQGRALHIQVTTRWIERRCMDKYKNFGPSPSRTLLWLRKLRKYCQKARRHP
jgi:hypothetical protein